MAAGQPRNLRVRSLLRFGVKYALEKPSSERFYNADGSSDFIAADCDLAAWNRRAVARFVDIFLIYDTHPVCKQVPFLKYSACSLPIVARDYIGKVECECPLYAASGSN